MVYLNSLFDYRFTILPLLVTRVIARKIPVVLAPRGELSASALALKRGRSVSSSRHSGCSGCTKPSAGMLPRARKRRKSSARSAQA